MPLLAEETRFESPIATPISTPEREREQDGGEGERVVAVVEHRGRGRDCAARLSRAAPNSSCSFSHSSSATSRSAGVIQTTATIAISPAAITTSSGVSPGRGR